MPKVYDPFAEDIHYTERTVNQRFVEWINRIIEEKNLPLGVALQGTGLDDRRQPDIVIQESLGSKRVLCLVEIKLPHSEVISEDLVDTAFHKARSLGTPYFATCNVNQLIWFSTHKARQGAYLPEQIIGRYEISDVFQADEIDEPQNRIQIQRNLERFLLDLVEVFRGEKPLPKTPIDEFLILKLQSTIKSLQRHYYELIKEKAASEPKFLKELQIWFIEQGWSFLFQDDDYKKAARQAAYLLVNKILFYAALQEKLGLDPLSIPEDLTDGGVLKGILEAYFKKVLSIDYETVFSTDFIDALAFPQNEEAVSEVKSLLRIVNRYQLSKIGYDIIGRIFESLIPSSERHKLGQYFTNADVVDLILRFCQKSENDVILDPACGAGTFLVRAYQHKEIANPRLEHEDILATLWGVDIAKFPAHLATVNLAVKELRSTENYPRIIHQDFFNLVPGEVKFPKPREELRVGGLGRETRELEQPPHFDCIVGNPPYTRQEEMEDVSGEGEGYKNKLIQKALSDVGEKSLAQISKRAGIYAYFFVHGTKFLREGGRFGFIVSNSWLDAGYGRGIQEFFLKNYKIVAIIESKVERWFEDADINTCIVILERCRDGSERDANLTRFAYLKKPLREFIPPAENVWGKEVERLQRTDELVRLILGHHDLYESKEIRIFPKKQGELWEEGFSQEEGKYLGSKWGKYLRAPDIFFTILEKGKGKLVRLGDIAEVRRGFTTGANEFFYLTEDEIERWGIEREFWMHKEKGRWVPNYILRSPRECKSISVDPQDLSHRVLLIHKDKEELKGTNVLKYIEWGESQGFRERPTCASRERWYDLGHWKPRRLLCPERFNDRFLLLENSRHVLENK
ncbi:hypothetical protein HKBW3S06_00756, partial [Candidatus Hakubella thermalkaliphila]